MEEKNQVSNVFIIFAFCTIVFIIFIIVFLAGFLSFMTIEIQLIVLRAMIFLYAFAISVLVFRLWFYKRIDLLAKKIGFRMLTKIWHQPRIQGEYKNKLFQIHYRSRDSDSPSFIRTYIKLIHEKQIDYDTKKLLGYSDMSINGFNVICVKHVIRPNKNYLLMKASPYIFDKRKIEALMDLLIDISKKCKM